MNRIKFAVIQLFTLAFLSCALSIHAQDTEAKKLIAQGNEKYDAGTYAEAIELYQHALVLAPNDAGIYNNLGTAYAGLKRYNEAVTALEKSVARSIRNLRKPFTIWALLIR